MSIQHSSSLENPPVQILDTVDKIRIVKEKLGTGVFVIGVEIPMLELPARIAQSTRHL